MMATLSVQEAMGFKVDREAVATLVLPQLWGMSIGPCMRYLSALYITELTLTLKQYSAWANSNASCKLSRS
jgi:hypothetical protein